MDEDVFLAILAMDTYMRDWRELSRYLSKLTTEIGTATRECQEFCVRDFCEG
jgi:hypothetical protein